MLVNYAGGGGKGCGASPVAADAGKALSANPRIQLGAFDAFTKIEMQKKRKKIKVTGSSTFRPHYY